MNPNLPAGNSLEKIHEEFTFEQKDPRILPYDENNIDPNKVLNLKVNIDTPSSEIVKEQTYDDLYMIIEKLASKRRTGSDNLISKQGTIKMSTQKKLSKAALQPQPQVHYKTPDKSPAAFQFQPPNSSQSKIQSMNLALSWNQNPLHPRGYTSLKTNKIKGLKTIDNPELLGFHKPNPSKTSNPENCPKKIVFTEPDMNFSEDPNLPHKKKYSKFLNPNQRKPGTGVTGEKNRSLTNFLKPAYSTGITSNSRPTKPTEEDFDSEEISEGRNCESLSQEPRNTREFPEGLDFEVIEKMNELSDGVKYTFGGVGVSHEGEGGLEGEEEEEKKESRENLPSLNELKNVLEDIEKRKYRYEEIDNFLSFLKKTHEKSRSEHIFTESIIGKQQEFPHKNEVTSPFTPKFHPNKLETIDEYTKMIFKKHLDNLKTKKRDVKSDDLNVRDKNCKVF